MPLPTKRTRLGNDRAQAVTGAEVLIDPHRIPSTTGASPSTLCRAGLRPSWPTCKPHREQVEHVWQRRPGRLPTVGLARDRNDPDTVPYLEAERYSDAWFAQHRADRDHLRWDQSARADVSAPVRKTTGGMSPAPRRAATPSTAAASAAQATEHCSGRTPKRGPRVLLGQRLRREPAAPCWRGAVTPTAAGSHAPARPGHRDRCGEQLTGLRGAALPGRPTARCLRDRRRADAPTRVVPAGHDPGR